MSTTLVSANLRHFWRQCNEAVKGWLSIIVRVNVVTVNNNSPIQDYIHLDAHAQLTYDNVTSFSQ